MLPYRCQCLFPPPIFFGYYNPDISYYPETRSLLCEIRQEAFQQQPHHHSNVEPNLFHGPNYLNTHMGPHTEDQKYQLPKYENDISDLFDPRDHVQNRPFTCEICKKTFRLHHHLKYHKKTHQSRSERAKFQCHLCPKIYISWYTLLSHIEEHQCPRVGFECEICHKHLKTKAGLTMHKRRHYGQVNYACKLCWKASFSPSEHNRHFRTHWKETPQESMRRSKIRMAALINVSFFTKNYSPIEL